jgi:hypothetical protein
MLIQIIQFSLLLCCETNYIQIRDSPILLTKFRKQFQPKPHFSICNNNLFRALCVRKKETPLRNNYSEIFKSINKRPNVCGTKVKVCKRNAYE